MSETIAAPSRLVASLALFAAAIACGSDNGQRMFDFSSPPAGSNCEEAAEHLRGQVRQGIKQVGKTYLHADPSPIIDRPQYPVDFAVFIDHPADRDEFRALKTDVIEEFEDWLQPSGLDTDDFRIVWAPYPPEIEPREMDPSTGRLIDQSLTPEDQVTGTLCE